MKLRQQTPWMPAAQYGKRLRGFTVNLLMRDVARHVAFAREVLGAVVVYDDPDFAVLRVGEAEWMVHADHTYDKHPLHASLQAGLRRGLGAELRVHGCDPDRAVQAAHAAGYQVLAEAMDKPHGLREAFIYDAEGYLWVPDVPLPD